ncbi:MAG: hypothetical protein CSA39_01210 [Flavobacteriales bacterium]|nr:MAG: hypothetical protein CSA39_01210 [Flavobacteriales bacterium]
MKRRDFIRKAGLSSVALPLVANKMSYQTVMKTLFSVDESVEDRVLVIIRMNGGNDGLNTVIPLNYYDNLVVQRQNIILPERDILDLEMSNLGFHSTMSGMRNMFKEGNLSIIQNVGYPNANRSHFKSTDIWTRGLINNNGSTGWLGRYLDGNYPNFPDDYPNTENEDPFAISFGHLVSATCQGLMSNFSLAVEDPENVRQLSTSVNVFEDSTYGDHLKFISSMIDQTNAYSVRIEDAMNRGNTLSQKYDDENKLAEQLRNVAQLISGGLKTKIYILNVNGFDTHSGQVESGNPNVGEHQVLLKTISDAVEAFQDDLKLLKLEERVMGMTFSEFGRQIASNDSYGTDHGEAAPMFLFGNCFNSQVMGDNPVISNKIERQKALDYQFDFRDIYASILRDWFLAPESEIQSLFEHQVTYYPLFACKEDQPDNQLMRLINVYPNPTVNTATLAFSSNSEDVRVVMFDLRGRLVKQVFSRALDEGPHQVPIDVSGLSAGMYVVKVLKESGDLSVKLLKTKY